MKIYFFLKALNFCVGYEVPDVAEVDFDLGHLFVNYND